MSTVLVVDDEFGIVDLIDAILSDEGYRVLKAANGRQALELAATEHPDLLFLDYMMPVMDGAATLRQMAREPELKLIPVVLMSSLPETTVVERCGGYISFMRKPFKIATVVQLAEQLIGVKKA